METLVQPGTNGGVNHKSVNHKSVTRNTGNITVNTVANTWEELATESGGPGAGEFDISLSGVAVGDVIEAEIRAVIGAQNVGISFDLKTLVGGSPVSSFAAQGNTVATAPPYGNWYVQGGVGPTLGGSVQYTLRASDISSGSVLLRPYVATTTATNRVVYADSNHLLQILVKNLNPAQA